TSRQGPGRLSNPASSSGRSNSTAGAGTHRPQNRRGSALSLTSLGHSGNVATSGIGNTSLSGGTFSLEEGDEDNNGGRAPASGGHEQTGAVSSTGDRRRDSGNRATVRVNTAGSEEEKAEDESCDGVVT
ncbi:hypothetical protein FHG87_004398, partial [Trinorchestia longiramus]